MLFQLSRQPKDREKAKVQKRFKRENGIANLPMHVYSPFTIFYCPFIVLSLPFHCRFRYGVVFDRFGIDVITLIGLLNTLSDFIWHMTSSNSVRY